MLEFFQTHNLYPLLNRSKSNLTALVSLTSTANSNITVGAPFELSSYQAGAFKLDTHRKFEPHGEYLTALEQFWTDGLNTVFKGLPDFDQDTSQSQQQMHLINGLTDIV